MIRLHNIHRSSYDTAIFFADNVSDIELLPNTTSDKGLWYGTVPFGSKCMVVTGEEYRLNSDDEWVLVSAAKGNDGVGDNLTGIATDDEVAEMLKDILG